MTERYNGVMMRAQAMRFGIILGFVAVFLAVASLLFVYGQNDILLLLLCFSVLVPVGYLTLERLVQRNELLRMRQEALNSELVLLKSQINPHFFFNTLNSLYALTVAGSQEAPQMILTLSDLMRFTIYDGKRDHVPLHQEVTYLQNYIRLQQMRFSDKLKVSFEIEVSDDAASVPPLLLIILVENAFKHGVSSSVENAWVEIRLEASAKRLFFEVSNNRQPDRSSKPGIGLTNLKRRLALLYPKRHQLSIEESENRYRASLELKP